ncbi:MAG: flagellar protein FlaG [Campylobacterota bacterium]|nr:flagellar protein FlaG [Campylobacterota bacterium]
MDGLTSVSAQQTQVTSMNSHEKVEEHTKEAQPAKQDLVKEAQEKSLDKNVKINSKEEVESLVEQLNEAMAPMGTSLKFGVDKDDIFYVSVIDQKTDDLIRRFPAEKGMEILPKMLEVAGIFFDSKG